MVTSEEIVTIANRIAREFYELMGYVVRDGYRFDKATHPQEKLCWDMACHAFLELRGTDVGDALSDLED